MKKLYSCIWLLLGCFLLILSSCGKKRVNDSYEPEVINPNDGEPSGEPKPTNNRLVANTINDFEYEVIDKGYKITGINNDDVTEIEVPTEVVEIEEGSFEDCTKVETVKLPFLGDARYDDGKSESRFSYIFGKNYHENYIKNGDKYYCPPTVKEINIYDDGYIPDGTFDGLSNIISILLPDILTYIGDNPFVSQKSIRYNRYDNAYYIGSFNNPYMILDRAVSEDIETLNIHPNCESISRYALNNCNRLRVIDVPDNVKNIGSFAFKGCNSVEKVTIPVLSNRFKNANEEQRNTRKFGIYWGGGSMYTQNDYVPETLKEVVLHCDEIGSNSFYGLSHIEKVTIEGAIEVLPDSAFRCCSSLKEVIINANIVKIEKAVFQDDFSLETIIIPVDVTIIEERVFNNCDAIKNIYYKGTPDDWSQIDIIPVKESNLELFGPNKDISSSICYYIESEPTDSNYNYWHYVDGVVTIW